METQSLELPVDLLQVISQLKTGDLAKDTAKLLALELLREDKVYGIAELEEDRRTLARLRQ